MKSKCSECWDIARKFAEAGNHDAAMNAAELGRRFAVIERQPRKVEHDHEGHMAVGELSSLAKNTEELLSLIQKGDELPGWVSAYITLASDYMNSVAQYMRNADPDDT
jgi:hypothetical protein